MKRVLALVAAASGLLGLADEGRACSRAVLLKPPEPRAVVASGDAAFVGTLVAVRRLHPLPVSPNPFVPILISSGDPTIFTFRVDEEVEGDLPDFVEVLSVASSATCGLSHTMGVSLGLVLHNRDGSRHASMFDEHRPDFVRLGRRSLRYRTV